MQRDILIDKNQMESIQHASLGFPFYLDGGNINDFLNRQVRCHWHREMEFTLVHSGRMYCKVNDREYLLEAGDCFFTNANALHLYWADGDSDCVYSSILIDASLFGQHNCGLRGKYVDPILESYGVPCFRFRRRGNWEDGIVERFEQMEALFHGNRKDAFELAVLSLLVDAWGIFYRNIKEQLDSAGTPSTQIRTLKVMLSYIQQNYTDQLTLDGIAASAGISKSSCSHIFKSYMKKSPFEYLMRYRIEKSLPLLVSGENNITETALATGFSSGSYYSEVFRRFMGVSPQQYRKTAGKD